MKPTNSPNPWPTKPEEKLGLKVAFEPLFFSTQQITFSWVWELVLHRKRTTRNLTPTKFSSNTLLIEGGCIPRVTSEVQCLTESRVRMVVLFVRRAP